MIICYMGTPGSGKSYDAVRKIMDNLKLGRQVYTNVEGFNEPQAIEAQKTLLGIDDYEYSRLVHWLPVHEVREFWKYCKPNSLIVIDEIHNYFNARDWNTKENRDFSAWGSTHRHEGYDLLMITQHIEKVDKQIRSLAQWTYHYRKIDYFGRMVKNSYECKSYPGDDISGRPFGSIRRQYDEKIFRCYNSYSTEGIKEAGIQKGVNILKHPVFYAIPILLGLTIYMVFFKSSLATGDPLGGKGIQSRMEERIKQPGAQVKVIENSKDKKVMKVGDATVIEYKDLMNKINMPPAAPPLPSSANHQVPDGIIKWPYGHSNQNSVIKNNHNKCDIVGEVEGPSGEKKFLVCESGYDYIIDAVSDEVIKKFSRSSGKKSVVKNFQEPFVTDYNQLN